MEYRQLTDNEKREVCAWRYAGAYARYNLPPFEQAVELGYGFVDPARAREYYGFFEDGALVGFAHLEEKDGTPTVGVGIRPDRCGQGLGRRMMEEVWAISRRLYPGKALALEVQTWNGRAIACYRRAGFQPVGEPFTRETPTGPAEFQRMLRES